MTMVEDERKDLDLSFKAHFSVSGYTYFFSKCWIKVEIHYDFHVSRTVSFSLSKNVSRHERFSKKIRGFRKLVITIAELILLT